MNFACGWKLGTDWYYVPLSSLQSAWCDSFVGRCLRRASQSKVTSFLTSGCHSGLMWRILQLGSSAIMQRTSNSWVKIRMCRQFKSQIVHGFCVYLVSLDFEVWNTAPVIIRQISMNINLACPCILFWGISVHNLFVWHPFYFSIYT